MKHLLGIALVLAPLLSCAHDAGARPSKEILAEAASLEVRHASSPQPGLLCSGQLSEVQLRKLADEGFKTFINLRVPTEEGTGWEPDVTADLGVDYVNLPTEGAAGITEEQARALRAALDEAARPVAVYCGSSNRVGALYGLAVHFADGKGAEEALDAGRSAGLTRLEPRVREVLGLPAEAAE